MNWRHVNENDTILFHLEYCASKQNLTENKACLNDTDKQLAYFIQPAAFPMLLGQLSRHGQEILSIIQPLHLWQLDCNWPHRPLGSGTVRRCGF